MPHSNVVSQDLVQKRVGIESVSSLPSFSVLLYYVPCSLLYDTPGMKIVVTHQVEVNIRYIK